MGSTLAGVTGRPKLEVVIGELKTAGVLAGASLTIALGYLKFRNDALHADWAAVDQASVGSCIAFTQALLVQHFS